MQFAPKKFVGKIEDVDFSLILLTFFCSLINSTAGGEEDEQMSEVFQFHSPAHRSRMKQRSRLPIHNQRLTRSPVSSFFQMSM